MKIKSLFFIFLLLIPVSIATSIENYNINYNIINKNTIVTHEITLSNPEQQIMDFSLPKDVQIPFIFLNNQVIEPEVINNNLKIQLTKETKDIRIKYTTKELIDFTSRKSYFVANIASIFLIKNLEVSLTLPEKAALDKPAPDPSAYPTPTVISSDGQRINLIWNKNNIVEFSLFVIYKFQTSWFWLILTPILILILIYFILKKPKIIKQVKIKKIKPDIEKYLKEEEKQVVSILKRKAGKCEQGTLQIISDFSKASLSRLLTEMEERNIIKKVKKGKKNIILLKEGQWNNLEQ